MKRIILFSNPTNIINKLLPLLFPESFQNKVFAYMPSDGKNSPEEFTSIWKKYAKERSASFNYIDNSTENEDDKQSLSRSNILLITGGNTFDLLRRLRESGLDKIIQDFIKKEEYVIAGFSAGAIVLTPSIDICNAYTKTPNSCGISDFSGLNIVPFEVFPHYTEDKSSILENYQKITINTVKPIQEDELLVLES